MNKEPSKHPESEKPTQLDLKKALSSMDTMKMYQSKQTQ